MNLVYSLPLVRVLPVAVHNPEGYVLVRWTGSKEQEYRVLVARFFDDFVCWGL